MLFWLRLTILICALAVVPQMFGVAGDANWDSRFTFAPGPNGQVKAMVALGNFLYVGGEFTRVNGIESPGIARWDGTNWSAVGSGVDGVVAALATDGTRLFVGGKFSRAGNMATTNLARWDGTNWSSIGHILQTTNAPHFEPAVTALLADGSKLFVGGNFATVGGVAVTNVATWNGTNWSALGAGLGKARNRDADHVYALAKSGATIFAGGRFGNAGSATLSNLARWNGTNWLDVGGGVSGGSTEAFVDGAFVSGAVTALCTNTDGLNVAGDFELTGTQTNHGLARWDGTNWSSLGVPNQIHFNALALGGANLVAGGSFAQLGAATSSGVALRRGANWESLGRGVFPTANCYANFGGALFVGGNFQFAGGRSAGFVARFDGLDWQPLLTGKNSALLGNVSDLAMGSDGSLFAAGTFFTAGESNSTNGLPARVAWNDGTNWTLLPSDSVVSPQRLALLGTNLFGSGYFTDSARGITNIAHWDGSQWRALSNVPAEYLTSEHQLAVFGGKLFFSGEFTNAGALAVTNLARWGGTNWSSIGYTPPANTNSSLVSLAANATALFALESVPDTNAVAPQLRVRRWDSTNWTVCGGTFVFTNQFVSAALACARTNIFLGVNLLVTNTQTVCQFLRWNGVGWTNLPNPLATNAQISTLVSDGTNLFVGANGFSAADGSPLTLAKWNGTNWSALGSGVTFPNSAPGVNALAVSGGDLFVAGNFSRAGGKLADNLAAWRVTPRVSLAPLGWQPSGKFGLRISGGVDQPVQLQFTTNLADWLNDISATPTNDTFNIEASLPTNRAHFFRLRLLP